MIKNECFSFLLLLLLLDEDVEEEGGGEGRWCTFLFTLFRTGFFLVMIVLWVIVSEKKKDKNQFLNSFFFLSPLDGARVPQKRCHLHSTSIYLGYIRFCALILHFDQK